MLKMNKPKKQALKILLSFGLILSLFFFYSYESYICTGLFCVDLSPLYIILMPFIWLGIATGCLCVIRRSADNWEAWKLITCGILVSIISGLVYFSIFGLVSSYIEKRKQDAYFLKICSEGVLSDYEPCRPYYSRIKRK